MSDEPASEKAFLATYNPRDFPAPLCTVDMSIFTLKENMLQVLLVKRRQYPKKNQWALPGGFIDKAKDQSLEDTAFRKLREKTGVDSPYLEQVASIGGAGRDPRGWSITVLYFALIAHQGVVLSPDTSSTEVCWVPYVQAVSLPLAFDHHELLKLSFERLKNKVLYTSLPVYLLPEKFTLPALQKTYETILGSPLQKKSFRKRFLDANILQETGEKEAGVSRSAMLYRLVSQDIHIFPRTLECVS